MVVCYLCKSSKEDDIQYGEMLQNENMAVHTFCLYLSSNLSQNGKDDEDFLGFLETDIKKEARRVSSLNCFYCRKAYANVGCCEKKCRHAFHFICGLDNNAENQFCGSFKSYCNQHVRKSNITGPTENVCVICYDDLQGPGECFNRVTMIAAPCCRNGWFHKLCLQRFAKTSGYFFKCPLCNDAEIFRQKLVVKGIFIPNQDAAWELEPNAFAELLERPNECAASECNWRTYSSSSDPFIFCSTCGSTAMHSHCIPNRLKSFQCADCTVAPEQDSGRGSLNTLANNNENDEEIDVCVVSDKEDLAIIQGLLQATEPQREDNENKAQHSCYSEDEEIKVTHSRRTRICSSDSNSSEKSKENRPPSSRSRSSSTCDDEPKISFTQRRSRKLRRDRVIQVSMSSEEDFANSSTSELRRKIEDDEVKVIQNPKPERCTSSRENDKRKHSVDVEVKWDSTTDESSNEETYSDVADPNHIFISSGEVEIIPIDDESDDNNDDELEPLEKNTQVQTKTTKALARYSPAAELSSSEESDDPVENFTKMIEKQKYISCIALRTRTKSVYVENSHQYNMQILSDSSADNKKGSFQVEDQSKSIKFQEKYKTNLDISCIARRTRRKSMYSKSAEMPTQAKSSKSLPQNEARNSRSAAISTSGRRKTVCSETAVEKNRQQKTHQDAGEITIFSNLDISCIARRTRRKSMYSKSTEMPTQAKSSKSLPQNEARNPRSAAINTSGRRKTVCSETAVEKNRQQKTHQDAGEIKIFSNLDISCIARRTRRKSMYSKSTEMTTQAKSSKSLPQNAIRTSGRRKTVCSETAVEKNKQHKAHQDAGEIQIFSSEDSSQTKTTRANQSCFYEMSQIFEKECDTDEGTGLHDKQQQKTNSKVLEISCIANRTRKRKYVKMLNIIEEDEPASSSCSSSTSYKTSFSELRSNYGWRRRQRILSSSSEGTENVYEDTISTQRHNNIKWPKQNYDMAFQTMKLHLRNTSYYPNNLHHPHINNRKRV